MNYIIAIILTTMSPYYIDSTGVYTVVEARYKNEQKIIFWKVDTLSGEELEPRMTLLVDDSTWNNAQKDTWSFIQHKDTADVH